MVCCNECDCDLCGTTVNASDWCDRCNCCLNCCTCGRGGYDEDDGCCDCVGIDPNDPNPNCDDWDDADYPDPGHDDFIEFADPGGRSALRAASPSNPRIYPCPTCGAPNRLTRADVDLGYQCDDCADRAERGW
jgi:hypothetical protein